MLTEAAIVFKYSITPYFTSQEENYLSESAFDQIAELYYMYTGYTTHTAMN